MHLSKTVSYSRKCDQPGSIFVRFSREPWSEALWRARKTQAERDFVSKDTDFIHYKFDDQIRKNGGSLKKKGNYFDFCILFLAAELWPMSYFLDGLYPLASQNRRPNAVQNFINRRSVLIGPIAKNHRLIGRWRAWWERALNSGGRLIRAAVSTARCTDLCTTEVSKVFRVKAILVFQFSPKKSSWTASGDVQLHASFSHQQIHIFKNSIFWIVSNY